MDSQPGPSRKKIRADDKDLEKVLNVWFDENEIADDNSDVSDAETIVSEHDSNSEQECDSSDEELEENENEFLYGKNGFQWSKKPIVSARSRTPQRNIVMQLPGLRAPFRQPSVTEKESWSYLFSMDILETIVKYTNQKLIEIRQKYKDPTKSDLRDLDVVELLGFLGLLFYTAAFRSNHENIRSLFATDGTGRDIFRCIMNVNRFAVLLQCLRFDDPNTRDERKKDDPTAAISEIFDKFVTNCQSAYSIGSLACVDEMLVGFRGRCKFKMYIANKPCKYGLKIMALTDSRNNYFFNGYIYCGKDSDGRTLPEVERKLQKPTQAVLRLSSPIQGSNRNITADNWFSSFELVNILKQRKLTYVGTVRKNKREIPSEFLPNRKRQVESSIYGFTKDMTLVSFVPKKGKAVLLVSSMHSSPAQDAEVNKPEIISFYNNTKSGVDSLDEKCVTYCTGRRTRRWPMAIMFRIMDISAVNAFILHQAARDNPQQTRLQFMKNLAKQLVTEELERRLGNSRLRQEVRISIRKILGKEEEQIASGTDKLSTRKYCSICPKKLKRKTSTICKCCKQPVCGQCSSAVCHNCI